jgi:hypothetical protein
MQVVRTLQKAWRDLGSNRTNIRASGTDQGLWTSKVDFALSAANQAALAALKKDRHGGASLSRHYSDPGALSGVVKGSSLESTTNTASKLADSFSLAFSLIL